MPNFAWASPTREQIALALDSLVTACQLHDSPGTGLALEMQQARYKRTLYIARKTVIAYQKEQHEKLP